MDINAWFLVSDVSTLNSLPIECRDWV